MESEIRRLPGKRFIGMSLPMSFAVDRTFELWHKFMSHLGEISNRVSPELYSIEEYPPGFFESFNPDANFKKWAALEVINYDQIPDGMTTLTSPQGSYAVFIHKGTAKEAPETYRSIFQEWLPKSVFCLDDRPHFAIMGEKYQPDDPNSEEEILIPVRPRTKR